VTACSCARTEDARILLASAGSGVSAGHLCLDCNNNTLKNSSDANNPSAEFNLVHNSTGTFTRRNGGGNVGTETTSGTIGSNTGCTLPSFQ
jgi:hypothetical protein